MTIIDLLLISLIIVLIIIIVSKKKKYESFDTDEQGYSSQFVYSAGRVKPETPEEEYLDDYNSSATIIKRRIDDKNVYDLEFQTQEYPSYYQQDQQPTYTPPTPPRQPSYESPIRPLPPFSYIPISPPRQPSYEPSGRPMPSFSDIPISPPTQPSYDMPVLVPTQPQDVPSVGIIKEEEEEEDTTTYSNVGRVIKKKRKLG